MTPIQLIGLHMWYICSPVSFMYATLMPRICGGRVIAMQLHGPSMHLGHLRICIPFLLPRGILISRVGRGNNWFILRSFPPPEPEREEPEQRRAGEGAHDDAGDRARRERR